MVCNLFLTVLTFLLESMSDSRVLKMSFKISRDILLSILYITVASIWRFLAWTMTDLSLEGSSSNDQKWYLQTVLNAYEVYYDLSICYELLTIVHKIFEANSCFHD